MQVDSVVTKAFNTALEVQKKAYAKYSNFHVGSAIKFKGVDKIYPGCNVENASYGATICAERSAVVSGISDLGKKEIEFVVVITDTDPVVGPCALCLQVIAEFCKPDMPIYMGNPSGIKLVKKFGELLTNPFTEIPEHN